MHVRKSPLAPHKSVSIAFSEMLLKTPRDIHVYTPFSEIRGSIAGRGVSHLRDSITFDQANPGLGETRLGFEAV